jgi:probable F420-dependent oxidoreductase
VRFAYYFPGRWIPPDAALLTGEVHARLALAAERAGFHGVTLDEHPAPSEDWRQAPGGHDALDPFVGLAAVSGVAKRVSLLTYLAVVPYRNPFLTAKAAATLDVMSDGRLILGMGTGYLEAEFRALGVDFAARNRLFDESLDVMKRAWTGKPVTHAGEGFTASDVILQPCPRQQPHPPLWIGGNSRLTMRRVAERANGWMPMPNRRSAAASRHSPPLESIDDLVALLGYLTRYADTIGRAEPIDVVHSMRDAPDSGEELVDFVGRLSEVGVTWVVVNGRGSTPDEAEEFIMRYGEEVISRVES